MQDDGGLVQLAPVGPKKLAGPRNNNTKSSPRTKSMGPISFEFAEPSKQSRIKT